MITLVLDTVTHSKKDQVVILHEALDRLVMAEVQEESVSNAIVENIRCFLTISKGRDKTDKLKTKQAILTACTYSRSHNSVGLDNIRDALGVSKNSFYHKTIARTTTIECYKPVGRSHHQTT